MDVNPPVGQRAAPLKGGQWRDLTPLMNPRRIAVVGASERPGFGTTALRNLINLKFAGDVYPVNPRYSELFGLHCYPDLASTPEPADCAVIATPAKTVPGLLAAAADKGIPAVVLYAGGFSEAGADGRTLQEQLRYFCNDSGILLGGPNCLGVANVLTRAAAFGNPVASDLVAGNVGFISQSGSVTIHTAGLLMQTRGVGFTHFVSCGNQADVTIEEYINYLLDDEQTEVIAAFVEGFKRPQELPFLGRKALDRRKPIIIYKVGNSRVAAEMTLGHTGTMAGAGEVVEAALRQNGLIQVKSYNELIETIALLSCRTVRERYRGGRRIAVLSGSGGTCSCVADVAAEAGLELPELSAETRERVRAALPGYGKPRNPVDGTGTLYSDLTIFPRLLQALADDPALDLIAVNISAVVPKGDGGRFWRELAKLMIDTAPATDKPLIIFNPVVGGDRDLQVIHPLRAVGVPFLDGAEFAMAACRNLAHYHEFLDRAPESGSVADPQPVALVSPSLPELHLRPGILDTLGAFRLLRAYSIPAVPTEVARTPDEAVAIATRFGYPVALKVESPAIQHKTDVGGVELGLDTGAAVRAAYDRIRSTVAQRNGVLSGTAMVVQPMAAEGVEVIMGIKRDPEIGPAVVCGLGGVLAEILDDVAVGIPPLSENQAQELLRRLRGWPLLAGVRGRPCMDVTALCRAIANLSRLAIALGDRIEGLDINPVIVHPEGRGVLAVDALVHLRQAENHPKDREAGPCESC